MTLEVDYVPFAIGAGANVYTPATYQALSVVGTGVEPGLADPQLYNTTARLASMVTAALANYISNVLGIVVLDDGNLTNLITNLTSAISTGAGVKPGRVVTSSATLTMVYTDYAVAMLRSASLSAMIINLPTTGLQVNQEFRIDDITGGANGFQAYPVTLTPPAGHDIAGLASVPLNINRQSVVPHYYGASHWGIAGVFA